MDENAGFHKVYLTSKQIIHQKCCEKIRMLLGWREKENIKNIFLPSGRQEK